MPDVLEWLHSIGLDEKFGKKMEEGGYNNMQKIQRLTEEGFGKMIAFIGLKDKREKMRMIESLVALSTKKELFRDIKIKYRNGVEIIRFPQYPSVSTGHRLNYGDVVSIYQMASQNYMGYKIAFYRLSDKRGWVHNFIAASPGEGNRVIEELHPTKKGVGHLKDPLGKQ